MAPGQARTQRLELEFGGFLVDLDGTLIDSTNAIVQNWAAVGRETGTNPSTILEMSHGRRSLDVLRLVAPEMASWDYAREIESRIPHTYGHLATEIPGAASFLDSLEFWSAPWAIVTSSTAPLATGWLNWFNLPFPKPGRLITAESVSVGKPDPSCYLLGHSSLHLDNNDSEILAIEDSPAGIMAAKEANCKVLGLLTSHRYEQIAASRPEWIARDLNSIQSVRKNGKRYAILIDSLDLSQS
ncbi:HAD-like domain-containing protein [Xylaria curta]|nr:HAD-like domain-containing protein [Xylaria curta]